MLSDRQLRILKWVVEEYVRTAEPVGSRTLADLPEFSFSSATIRNDLQTLEELGYVLKTHTSSGRAPTVKGYKLYVSEVLKQRDDGFNDEFPMIDEIFRRNETSKEDAIKESMSLVSQLTNYASVALGSTSYNAKIKNLHIVKVSEHSAVLIMVTDQGYVESKKILIPDSISFKDINRVITILNESLHDCPISDINNCLSIIQEQSEIKRSIEYYDELVGVFVRAVSEMVKDKYFMSGQTNILNFPEFQDINKVKEILSAMERQEIFKLVDFNNSGISVNIGSENRIQAMKDCSIISVPFVDEFGDKGAIAVIGPTRMEYQKVIPLLNYIAKYMGK